MGKGDSKKQMGTANTITQQQLAEQQKQLLQYQNYVKQLTAGGGYLPGVQSALTSNAINSVPQAYNQIGQELNTQAMARGLAGGGNLPGGGGYLRGYGNLLSAEENQKSQLLNNIIAGGQQNIAGAEQGILQGAGISAGVGSNALSNATSAANNSTNATTGLIGSIVGSGLGVLGSALGKPPAAPCWVAAELYGGWLTPETNAIRHWLLTTWWMRPFLLIYQEIGPVWAELIRMNGMARRLTKRLFDLFLRLSNA